jgi:hypothetical protein
MDAVSFWSIWREATYASSPVPCCSGAGRPNNVNTYARNYIALRPAESSSQSKYPFSKYISIHFSIHQYTFTYLRSWALLEQPPTVQPLKNFPAFYGTRKFITVFTRALHWSIFWARSIQSISSYPVSLISILILFTHLRLGLPSDLFPSGFATNILHAFLQVRGFLWNFVTSLFLWWGVVSPTHNPQVGGPPLVGCFPLLAVCVQHHYMIQSNWPSSGVQIVVIN